MEKKETYRILICGGRDYTDRNQFEYIIKQIVEPTVYNFDVTIIQGGASGADFLAKQWALFNPDKVGHEEYKADWDRYDKGAGGIRNQVMLDTGIDLVIAFPGGSGTGDMCRRADDIDVMVLRVPRL